jgi:hypothetical protein
MLYVAVVEEEMRLRSDDLTSLIMKALIEGVESCVPLSLMRIFPDYVAVVEEEMRLRSDDLTSLIMKALIEGVESCVPLSLMLIFPDYVAVLSCLVGAGMLVGVL